MGSCIKRYLFYDACPKNESFFPNFSTMEATTPVVSAFKQAHARYRRRPHEPNHTSDLHEMVDFRNHRSAESLDERIVCWSADGANNAIGCRARYGLRDYPGFEFWPCALSRDVQLYLALAAVSTYCEPPHQTNLDTATTTATTVTTTATDAATTTVDETPVTTDTMAQLTALQKTKSIWDTWKASVAAKTVQQERHHTTISPATTTGTGLCSPPRFPLSWATLGYHYDWTARAYHRHDFSPMPTALSRLATYFATRTMRRRRRRCTEQQQPINDDDDDDAPPPPPVPTFSATAGIVNYYHAKSVMGGHRDDLEEAVTQPVVSVSVGRPAVFVLGGPTLDSTTTPVMAMIVRSGDVLILGGPSRLHYHSMARLLPENMDLVASPDSRESWHHQVQLSDITSDDEAKSALERLSRSDSEERDALLLFLAHHRININLRQVYNSDPV
jgi:alkylated DNA repair dioxygenase AlkB